MKKQFFRVKQLADQTFSRAGKTEVLSDDLQAADRRVEFIRLACQNTSKKLSGSLQTQGQDATAREKRLKKNAEYLLGIAMLESGTCEEDCLLRHVISECGKLEMCLANACVDHEARVEASVLATLQQVCDVDVPNIMKYKRNLAKLILDMDSARTRYQTAVKHNSSSSSQGNKVESIRDELEEAETKVEQCRDGLACEMFQLIAKEAELATTVLEYARLQRSYHQTALATLDEMIPELESSICDCSVKPVFGVSLEEHLRVTNRKIAYPIELCVCALSVLAMDEEGLFRVAGGASKIRRMKLSLDANCMSLGTALEYRDPHVIASVLKSYLRQLPEPLMTHKLHDQWIAAAKVTESNDARLQALWGVVQQLPPANLENLRYLVKFLALLSQNQEVNKMTPQNIAIVVAPNLLWSPNDDGNNINANMNTASLHSLILDSLVTYSDWFFPGEYEMFVTLSRVHVVNGHTRTGSGDTQLISTETGIKRTQSSSSLSEDQSPPQGSPKPVTRNRKNKPAPVPPANPPNRDSVVVREINRDSMVVVGSKTMEECSQNTSAPGGECQPMLGFERLLAEKKTEDVDKKMEEEKKTEEVEKSQNDIESFATNKAVLPVPEPSKPPEPLKPKPELRGSVELVYGTLERKRPPRPTPAPRSSVPDSAAVIGGEKPAVPERPATLQRPLSSSFRLSRNLSEMDSDKSTSDGPVSLERAHMYSVDKQQVSIIQVSGGEKPERPPKPEMLGHTPGHKRTASEGNVVDVGSNSQKSPVNPLRPPRPTPPPPPTPKLRESTDL
ncbi:rho GTPase-activating protein 17-like isoform X2 [Homalodisca vitripennis]|uniref:rho GTPase-activating protein 17-like isoform X2 n=1 Tax=Homalodisca vitripennis TaxID=197043 RepID=UPI001EEC7A2E|nr:rho GTPase-activating protein 17-like isoform X2 [Homalodisca vitripennis]